MERTAWLYFLLVVGIILLIAAAVHVGLMSSPWPDDTGTHVDPIIVDPAPAPKEASVPAAPADAIQGARYKPKGFVREQVVCQTLERLYSKGFPTVRPPWLRNPATGMPLEYDCYNEELQLAGEHNGEHHYIFPNSFHKSEQEFLAQRARDDHKRRLSEEHGVYLITVPYWVPHALIAEWTEYYTPERVLNRQKVETLKPPK